MPYIPGRTFRNPQERGDYDTEGRAVLTDDQLALIFIRFIVDVYHQTQHRGLLGETPADALERLGGTTGVPPRLTQKTRRRAFGIRQERKVTARGIRFLGIDYGGNCRELQAIRKEAGTNKRAFYVDPDSLGTISVWNEGAWLDVDCSVENFHQVKLVDWIEVGKILRARYSSQADLKTSIIFTALSDLRKRSTEAQAMMGVLPQMFTSADLERLDRELYWGLSVVDDTPKALHDLPSSENGMGYRIGETPTGTASQVPTGRTNQVVPPPPTNTENSDNTGETAPSIDQDDDDDDWFNKAIEP